VGVIIAAVWEVTPSSSQYIYQRFAGNHCLHLQDRILEADTAGFPETSVFIYQIIRRHFPEYRAFNLHKKHFQRYRLRCVGRKTCSGMQHSNRRRRKQSGRVYVIILQYFKEHICERFQWGQSNMDLRCQFLYREIRRINFRLCTGNSHLIHGTVQFWRLLSSAFYAFNKTFLHTFLRNVYKLLLVYTASHLGRLYTSQSLPRERQLSHSQSCFANIKKVKLSCNRP
jgi:hypothetical protein